jgi:uncharacterized OB-fold protein
MTRPVPIPDPVTAPYWETAREGRFVLPRCEDCGKFHFYPRGACPHCGAAAIAWSEASGRGMVYSFSVVHRAPSAAFKEEVPYVIAIVATDDGPHLLSRLVGVPPEAVRIGMRLRVRFDRVSEEAALPVFEPERPPGI